MYKFLLQTIIDGTSLPTQLDKGLHEGDTRGGGEEGGGATPIGKCRMCVGYLKIDPFSMTPIVV